MSGEATNPFFRAAALDLTPSEKSQLARQPKMKETA